MINPVTSADAPAAIGPYSQGVAAGEFVFVSGQLPVNPADGTIPDGVAAQAEQSLANVEAILSAAELGMGDVVKTLVLLSDMEHFAEVNEVYASKFAEPYPARSCFAVKGLPKGADVEIEVIARRA